MLNSLLGILFRFRENKVGVVGDISKMYHSIKIGKFDQHVHRFLWRDMNTCRDPDQYVLTAVTFGDRPSGTIATMALMYTAEMYQDEYPYVTKAIRENAYMDDIIFSVANTTEAYAATSDIETVLGRGNFHMKHWVVSGEEQQSEGRDISGSDAAKVLGLLWIPAQDNFVFKVLINFSRKVKGARVTPGMTKDQCLLDFPVNLTRRMVLRQVASLYDPLGFLVPVTLKAKLMMRCMIRKEAEGTDIKSIDWDEPLAETHVKDWHEFFLSLYDIEMLSFPRCIKPINAVREPMLIMFSDGSRLAYGCCAYLRWQLSSGGYDVYLIASRNRIGPVREITIPRMELCGAVLSCRLRECIERELNLKYKEVMHIVDSTIVCSQIQKESHGFNTFVASRVAEIQCKSDPSEWWWVDSEHNVADLVTKPCEPHMLSKESMWQKGPEFLSKPQEEWPVCRSVVEKLPDRRSITLVCSKEDKNILSEIKLDNFTSYVKLLKVTSRVLSCVKTRSLRGALVGPSAEDIRAAEDLWIRTIQSDMVDWQQRYKSLGPVLLNGIIVVGQRIAKWLKDNWNQEQFILLPAKHPFTKLYILHLHQIDHGGVESTLARLQSRFWVPGARRIIKSVKKRCVMCRKYYGKVEDQCMGQVSDVRMKPTPPFYHTATDLFGPFTIKDAVKRRTRGKCFGVIYTCLTTRAVHLDIAENYSTEAFLGTFRRFVSIRGYPCTMHSDNGPQLVAANKELRDVSREFDLNSIPKFGSNKGVKWEFNKSSDAPWLNGACESLIRLVKSGLLRAVGDSVLTFSELQTTMYEVASLLNNRPIGMKPGYNIELGVYLCPNDLLLGHNNLPVPTGAYATNEDPRRRLEFIQSIVSSFWKKWQRDYFPTLFIRQKWHVERRNIRVGDIVLVQDPNPVRGKWKLAQVSKVEESRDGVVREVKLRYKMCKPGNHYQGTKYKTINRSVHRLVVLLPVEEQ